MVAAATTIFDCLGKNAKAVVKTVGIIEPPRKPCSARNTIMLWMSQAESAHNRLVSSEADGRDAQNSQRVDITRESQPDSGMTMISAIR